jgi:hypothetical protein
MAAVFLDASDWQLLADSVEKVAPLPGLRKNLYIGQQGSTQHDGTAISFAGCSMKCCVVAWTQAWSKVKALPWQRGVPGDEQVNWSGSGPEHSRRT